LRFVACVARGADSLQGGWGEIRAIHFQATPARRWPVDSASALGYVQGTMKPHLLSRTVFGLVAAVTATLFVFGPSFAAEDDLAAKLRALDPAVLKADDFKDAPLNQMLSRDATKRRTAVNERDLKAWEAIKTKADWEKFRDVRIKALKESLGTFP